MPVTYSIRSNLLRLVASGEYGFDEVPRAFLAALDDPACPNPVALLLDVRESRSIAQRSMDEIRAAGEFLGPYAARVGGKVAVLTGSELQFGLSRMGSVYSETVGIKAGVFRDERSALEWLGVKDGPAEG